MDLDFYMRVRKCKKRLTGKQPLLKLAPTSAACMYIMYLPSSNILIAKSTKSAGY